jgi:hypothetical protein
MVNQHTGRIVEATIKAIIDRTDGKRLQVDFGKDETALVYLWQIVRRISGMREKEDGEAARAIHLSMWLEVKEVLPSSEGRPAVDLVRSYTEAFLRHVQSLRNSSVR